MRIYQEFGGSQCFWGWYDLHVNLTWRDWSIFKFFFIKLEYNTLKQKLSTRISFINHLSITSVVVISRFTCKVLSMTLSPLSHTEEEEDIWNNKILNEKKKKKKKKKKLKELLKCQPQKYCDLVNSVFTYFGRPLWDPNRNVLKIPLKRSILRPD